MDKQDLTTGKIVSKLILFFLPIVASTLFQQLYNAVDALIVGKYVGTEALAAVGGSAAHIINLLIGFFVAMTTGAAVIISHLYGADKKEELKQATMTAYIMCVVIGAALTLIGIVFAKTFLRWMKTPEDTIEGAALYLRIYFSATIAVLVMNMEAGVLRAVGDSRTPFLGMLYACLANIVLDYVFVKFFHWGIAGVALATVISQIINMVMLSYKLLNTDKAYKLDLSVRRVNTGYMKQMLRIGIPAGMQSNMYGISNMLIQVGINTLGTAVVAGWTLSGKIDGFYWATMNAVGATVTSFVAQNYGAGKKDRIKECVNKSLILFTIMTIILSIVILLIAKPAVSMFSDDPEVRKASLDVIYLLVPTYFTWSYIEVMTGMLKGMGDAIGPVIITGLGICLFRVVWVFTIFQLIHTLNCIALCYPASWVLTDIIIFFYEQRRKKKEREFAAQT